MYFRCDVESASRTAAIIVKIGLCTLSLILNMLSLLSRTIERKHGLIFVRKVRYMMHLDAGLMRFVAKDIANSLQIYKGGCGE